MLNAIIMLFLPIDKNVNSIFIRYCIQSLRPFVNILSHNWSCCLLIWARGRRLKKAFFFFLCLQFLVHVHYEDSHSLHSRIFFKKIVNLSFFVEVTLVCNIICFMCTILYCYLYKHYSVLTTKSLISIHHQPYSWPYLQWFFLRETDIILTKIFLHPPIHNFEIHNC